MADVVAVKKTRIDSRNVIDVKGLRTNEFNWITMATSDWEMSFYPTTFEQFNQFICDLEEVRDRLWPGGDGK